MHTHIHLHETEKPIMLDGAAEPVGYVVQTKDFEFTAIYETDGSVNVYVEWGDDQPGDMSNHHSMAEAKRYLDTLLKAAAPKLPDMAKVIEDAVTLGLAKAGLPDIPRNRLSVLNDVHTNLTEQGIGPVAYREAMHVLEDKIITLQDQL